MMGTIKVNEFNEYIRDSFSESGDIVIKSMMGGYLVYFNGKLIGDICNNELFLKRTPTSDRLLADSELRYPYEGSKTLMHVFDSFAVNHPVSHVDKINIERNKEQCRCNTRKHQFFLRKKSFRFKDIDQYIFCRG